MEPPRPRSAGFAGPRRIFTAPVAPSAPQPAASPLSSGLVDTLYDHPNVKIVSFTAGSRSLSVGPRTASAPDIEPGSLSWSSQLERTIAVGPFRIYRAPGSVAFLSCGSALQPILPKSQVWCVDEESSKYVLQIRRPQYWRIEVPVEEQEDVRRAHQLREVFDAILQFEKTECPFQRSFTVELPERPQTPVIKRPWTPVRRSSASLPLTPVTPVEVARLHEGTPRGSVCVADLRTALDARRALNEHMRNLEPPEEESLSKETEQLGGPKSEKEAALPRHAISQIGSGKESSAGAHPQRVPRIAAPRLRIRDASPAGVSAEEPAYKSSTESLEAFRRQESWLSTPLPPSPPLSTPGSPRNSSLQTQNFPETAGSRTQTSDNTVPFKSSQTLSVPTADSLSEPECSSTTAPSSLRGPDCSSPRNFAPTQPPATTEPAETLNKREPETPSKAPSSVADTINRSSTPSEEDQPSPPYKTPSSTPIPSSSPSPSPSLSTSPSTTRRPTYRRATTTSSSISPSRASALSLSSHSTLPPPANLLTTATTTATIARRTSFSHTTTTTTTTTTPPKTKPKPTTNTHKSASASAGIGGPSNALAAVRRLPFAVLHKTCEILMSPPSHLLHLMLNVAARIAAGEWRGFVFGLGEGGERVSVAWDWSEDENDEYHQGRHGRYEEGRVGGLGLGGGLNRGRGGGRRGWATGLLEEEDDDDFWSRGRAAQGRGPWQDKGKGKVKMVGAFPESDDDVDDDDGDDNNDDEEEVGPLDRPLPRNRSLSGSTACHGEDDLLLPSGGEGERGKDKDLGEAEWGVD